MRIKIPDTFMGKPIQGSMEKLLESQENRQESSQSPQRLELSQNINRSDYIKIPNTSILISKREIHKGKNWEETHYALAQDGLFMPSPAIFMDYFLKVKEAAEGKLSLKDAEGNSLSRQESSELWDYISSTDRAKFNGKLCWTWLDARFVRNVKMGGLIFGSINNQLELITQHRVVNGNLEGRTFPLESYANTGYVTLQFNKQGLATRNVNLQSYGQGSNIYFEEPAENYVARFEADSGEAGLDCEGSPSYTDSALGVFACAEFANIRTGGTP